MPEALDVLAVMAHPDDAELLCGGSLLKCADRGERTGVLDLTRGESGTFGSAGQREREAARAADILGLSERRCAGLPDAALENTPAARVVVAALLRELRPTVVVTHWREGRHPDHRVAAALTRDACYLAGLKNLSGLSTSASGLSPHRPHRVVHATAIRDDADPPSFVVDVTEQMERKIEALAAYGTQFEGKRAMGEVYAGGERALYDQVRVHAARAGARIRRAYGEPFRAAETAAVVTLGELGDPERSPSTF